VAALCLRKLGRDAVLLERDQFPRYRIGESLLPGTMSILNRLGVIDRVEAAGFPKKRAATFLWGTGQEPWSFTFSTPKTAPWVYDHAFQVTRGEFDAILLDAARERGTEVVHGVQVTDVATDDDGAARVAWSSDGATGVLEADFVVDASGASGVIARKHGLRRWDEYYKNLAIWSYFKGAKRYKGDLAGNIFSVSFRDGWMWFIPQKDDMYSVGVVTGLESNDRLRELGPEAFYLECLDSCAFAVDTLAGAERVDEVRVVRDWAYDASRLTVDRAFMCGDSACFIDPLFSQGVHLATYSGMLAAAAIDYLLDHPDEHDPVTAWFEDAYRSAYNRYHKFLSAFYFHCDEEDSTFWRNRRIESVGDERFEGKEWFLALAGQESEGLASLQAGSRILRTLWDHGGRGLTEEFDESALSIRRVRWAADFLRTLRGLAGLRWTGAEVELVDAFSVHPTTFKLQSSGYLGDGNGRVCRSFPLSEDHRRLFEGTIAEPLRYDELIAGLRAVEPRMAAPDRIVRQLLEDGLLEGFDAKGEPVAIEFAMRFGGVGGDDDLS
jgi:flavin-dependent dehydrogenase